MSGKIVRSSAFVLMLIIVGKVLSFLRDIIISSKFGSTHSADAYFAANNISSILFTAILSSYIVLLIPSYKKIQTRSGDLEADIFASRVINFFIVSSISLSVIGYIFNNKLIYFVAPGFNEKTHQQAVLLGKVLILSFPFSSVTSILATISNANSNYFAPHIIPVFSALFVGLGTWLFADKYGIMVLAVSGVIAYVFQLFIQISISKKHFIYTFDTHIIDHNVKKLTLLVLPVFLGYSIDQINLLVNSIICSNLSVGSLSSLNYAQRLQATINGTLSTAIITVLYPLISKLASENDLSRLTEVLKSSFKGMTLLLIPIVVFLAINSVQFVSIVYFRGKFDKNAVSKTSDIFLFYSINVLFLSLRELIIRIYYIKNDTRFPFVNSAISMIINLILSILLVKLFSISGLSLANLIATVVSTGILIVYLPSKGGVDIKLTQIFSFFKKMFLPIVIYFLFQLYMSRYVVNNIVIFTFFFVFSMLQFLFLLIVFKQKDALLFVRIIKYKIQYVF